MAEVKGSTSIRDSARRFVGDDWAHHTNTLVTFEKLDEGLDTLVTHFGVRIEKEHIASVSTYGDPHRQITTSRKAKVFVTLDEEHIRELLLNYSCRLVIRAIVDYYDDDSGIR